MRIRSLVVVLMLLADGFAAALGETQTPAALSDLPQNIANLASLDFPVRMQAARVIRRTAETQAVPALVEAVRRDSNEFVRYRALVLLTSFSDHGTGDLMRQLMRDPNDRLRDLVFKWFEDHPDPRMASTFVGLLGTEQAEFVRPSLVGALAALGADPMVQRSLVGETTRGLDFFRSAVIEALGRHHARYALDAIVDVSRFEGPLQDDAVLAIGRIGGTQAEAALNDLTKTTREAAIAIHAARCLMGDDCAEHLAALVMAATAVNARVGDVRAAVDGLSVVGQNRNQPALEALLRLAARGGAVREGAAVGLAGVALRQPDWTVAWMNASDDATRETAVALLKDGFDRLDEDFAEERFFAAVRAGYWRADEGSAMRTLCALLIQKLEF